MYSLFYTHKEFPAEHGEEEKRNKNNIIINKMKTEVTDDELRTARICKTQLLTIHCRLY